MTISDLQKEQSDLYWFINKVSKRIEYAPKGKLRISPYNGKARYYHRVSPNDKDGIYIPDKKADLVKSLAQKEYDELELNALKEKKQLVDCLVSYMEQHKPGGVYDSLSPLRKELVTPIEISDEDYVSQWLNTEYEHSIFETCDHLYSTAKGDMVDSSSKATIADMLYKASIPYRQGFPIVLIDGSEVRPDFLLLNPKTRTEIVFEHFENMDNAQICEQVINRLFLYTRSGYVLGKNLLVSFETTSCPLNLQYVQKMIGEYFEK